MTTPPENPWATPQGRVARAETLRRLAQGEGEIAEYAKEVLAGRVDERALLYSSILSDNAVSNLHQMVDQWQALPEDQRADLVANADTRLRDDIAALAEAATEPDPPAGPPDEDQPPDSVLRDAW
jgi:hypothetical protein